MWQPTEKCGECGGTTIRECDDADASCGYSAVEWRCMDCGAICEECVPEHLAVAPSRKPATVATLMVELNALGLINVRVDEKEVA